MNWPAQIRSSRAALNRPDLSRYLEADETPVRVDPVPELTDWPAKATREHPRWWQVFRLELHGSERRQVLIAECRTEAEAFRVVHAQAHQCLMTRWNHHGDPYVSHREPLVVE